MWRLWCWLGVHSRAWNGLKGNDSAFVCMHPECTWRQQSVHERLDAAEATHARARSKIDRLKSGDYRPSDGALSFDE